MSAVKNFVGVSRGRPLPGDGARFFVDEGETFLKQLSRSVRRKRDVGLGTEDSPRVFPQGKPLLGVWRENAVFPPELPTEIWGHAI